MSIILLAGPVGAGKSTVAKELIALLSSPASLIEGDRFWSFFSKPHDSDGREVFRVMMRSVMAAGVPMARTGYDVVLDFSFTPGFRPVARKIAKDIPVDYIVLRPPLAVCEQRAAVRTPGTVKDYSRFREFYGMFEQTGPHEICNEALTPAEAALQIHEGLKAGRFRLA